MAGERAQRRLAAIMAADVVGYPARCPRASMRFHSCIAVSIILVAIFAYDSFALPITVSEIGTTGNSIREHLWLAQRPPSESEFERYEGLHAAVTKGNIYLLKRLISAGENVEARDAYGRTPLMVAGYKNNHAAARTLINAGAKLNAFDNDRYDVLTISAVLDDLEMVRLVISAGADTKLITSPYEGTALIAAAHLGHVEVVRALIDGKAPLDHVNNLGWTALIEAIVLGDGGPRHIAIVRALIDAGADHDLPDRNGITPLALAQHHGHEAIIDILQQEGARP